LTAMNYILKPSTAVLRYGMLLFTLSMLILGLKERSFTVWGERELWQFPTWFYPTVGWIALCAAGLVIVMSIVKPLRDKLHLEDILADTPPRSLWQNALKQINWMVLWTAYACGFIRALSALSPRSVTFEIVFWFGIVLLVVLSVFWVRSPGLKGRKASDI